MEIIKTSFGLSALSLNENEKGKVLMKSPIDSLMVELQLSNYGMIFCYDNFNLIENENEIQSLIDEIIKKQHLTENDEELIEMAYSTTYKSDFVQFIKEADTLKAKRIIENIRENYLSEGSQLEL